MRQALAALNSDLVLENYKYVMRITGDSEEGKRELENFQSPEERYPVIATTSKLMTTGVDVQTCKLIVLDANIGSMFALRTSSNPRISGSRTERREGPYCRRMGGEENQGSADYVEGGEAGEGSGEAREKPVVAGVEVRILNARVQTLGPDGRLITESLRDYTRKSILGEYRSLGAFGGREGYLRAIRELEGFIYKAA